jgi:VIT1/CCC1 family predicted Fe2+/Mn2+ transporter
VPLFPYLVGAPLLRVSLSLTAIALVSGGMVVGRLTGRPVLRSGLRQLALGGVAIAVTYLVGHLIGSHGS